MASEARRLQAEDLFRFRLAGDVTMSPDGALAAYVVKGAQAEQNDYDSEIHLLDLQTGESRRFTFGERDSAPQFSPDGESLAFLSRRSGKSQVWLMPLHGGEAAQVTAAPKGVTQFAWSPDGEQFAFIATAGEVAEAAEDDLFAKHTSGVKTVTELLYKLDGVGYFGEERPCLFVVPAGGGSKARQLTNPPYRVSSPVWSSDGSSVYVLSRMNPADYDRGGSEQQVWAVPAAGGAARQVSASGLSVHSVTPAPEGNTLALIAAPTDGMSYDNLKLYFLRDDADGPAEAELLQTDYPFPLADKGVSDFSGGARGTFAWTADGKSLVGMASEEGATYLVCIDHDSGNVKKLTTQDQYIFSYAFSPDGQSAVYAANEPLRPGVIKSLSGLEVNHNTELLAGLELSEPARFTAHAEDGPAVGAWLMKPAGFDPSVKHPAVLQIHGGPALMYTSGFFFEFQLLAAQGYAVVYGNPRGSHGYGEEFCRAIKFEWGGVDYDDLMAITDQALADNGWLDAERFGVAGGSYGGYMTNWIVGHTDRFAAAVTGRSIADWRSAIGSGDLGTFRFKRVDDVPYWDDNSWYEQQSPITYVGNVRTPILIEHQEEDHRCTIDQAFAWYTAIKYLNQAPTRLVIYPGEGHGMSRDGKPWHRIHRLKETLDWFGSYLGEGRT